MKLNINCFPVCGSVGTLAEWAASYLQGWDLDPTFCCDFTFSPMQSYALSSGYCRFRSHSECSWNVVNLDFRPPGFPAQNQCLDGRAIQWYSPWAKHVHTVL